MTSQCLIIVKVPCRKLTFSLQPSDGVRGEGLLLESVCCDTFFY